MSLKQRKRIAKLVNQTSKSGVRKAKICEVLGVRLRTIQRWEKSGDSGDGRQNIQHTPRNKLSKTERESILQLLDAPEYSDLSPSQIVPLLADKGRYIASESTMYRLLRGANQLCHRHASRVKQHQRPQALTATGPNQLYSWDITYMASTIRGLYFYLYLFMDIYSRKIVGWQVYDRECSERSAELLESICLREGIDKCQVTLHSDNGGPMKGVTMLARMQELGVIPSFSRPGVSDDNPYSEALFRTVKYTPTYPGRFGSLRQARAYMERFVQWYNHEHYHSGIRFVTPALRHRGDDKQVLAKRKSVYEAAKTRHPERWSGNTRNWDRIETVLLNPEKRNSKTATLAEAA